MIRILNTAETPEEEIFDRGGQSVPPETEAAVRTIIEDVRANGDEAVLRYMQKFDGVAPEQLRVSEEEIDRAFDRADPAFLNSLRQAAGNISAFHERQKREGFRFEGGEGIVLGQRVMPLDTVGVYVPGGTASYPSTVLMNVIPAKIAGVRRIVMTTPCGRDGTVSGDILAAARVAGVTDVFGSEERRPWRHWPTGPRACPGSTRSWAPATSMWPPQSAWSLDRWTST